MMTSQQMNRQRSARGGYEPLQSVGHLKAFDTGMATYRLYSSDLIGVALLVALLAEDTSGKSVQFPDGADLRLPAERCRRSPLISLRGVPSGLVVSVTILPSKPTTSADELRPARGW